MSKTAGYFLVLRGTRKSAFQYRDLEMNYRNSDFFAEPVPEFAHSRNVPLICFILDDQGALTHVGLATRGMSAGTGLRRLNIDNIQRLKKPQSVNEIIQDTSSRVQHFLREKSECGGLISPKSFGEFLSVLLRRAPELNASLLKFSKERAIRIANISQAGKKSLAEQKEAVLTALNIAGIDKSEARGYDYSENKGPSSFLDGIEKVRLDEDPMVINDLDNFPGFDLIRRTTFGSAVFHNENTTLTVILANRQPLELLTGTDLIYYNENFECFVMVQYKAMEKRVKDRDDDYVFRVPDEQLEIEIERMDLLRSHLNTFKPDTTLKDYRVSNQPFFIKLCRRLDFEPDDVGLCKGMYIPLDYFKLLKVDDSIKGKKGGMAISYLNIGRHFDNTAFKTIVEGGWIGTHVKQSSELRKLIESTLSSGRAVVVAIKSSIAKSRAQEKENDDEDEILIPD